MTDTTLAVDIAALVAGAAMPDLVAVARRLTGDETATVVGFNAERLQDGAGNPTSVGVWRIAGLADVGGEPQSWSAVLKVVTLPDEMVDDHDDERYINYWRREIEVFNSPLFAELPDGVAVPAWYGVTEFSSSLAGLWLEDLGTLDRAAWTLERYVLAVRALALLERPFTTGSAVPDHSWINREVPRRWWHLTQRYYRRLLLLAGEGYEPLRPLLPADVPTDTPAWLRLLYDAEPLLTALDQLPQVLCHNDPNIDNLVFRDSSAGALELVLLDLQWAGTGGVGTELGQLLSQIPAAFGGSSRADIERLLLDAYWHELISTGAAVSRDQVELGFSASAAVRQTCFSFSLFSLDIAAALDRGDDVAVSEALADHLLRFDGGPMPRLAARAFELAERFAARTALASLA